MLRADAAPFWARVAASAALDADGTHVCRAVIADITELSQAEEVRVKAEARLGQLQKAESLGIMAGAIAHHFNILIHSVMGNLELATSELSPGGKPHENLIEAMRAMNRSSELTSQLLTYVGEVVGKPEALDVSAVCLGSLPVLRAALLKDLVLETDLPSPGPIVRASSNQLRQVLTILVANAWEAVGESLGVIRLATRTVSAADIPAAHRFPVGWQPQEIAYACLEVAEKGRGIAEDEIGKIFDPCFANKLSRGLGLPVVLGIVRAHGGVVTVESEPGKGSTFRVFLPILAD
jgi:signal transduction histidine kinase